MLIARPTPSRYDARALALPLARLKGSRSICPTHLPDPTYPPYPTHLPYPTHPTYLTHPAYRPLNSAFRFARKAVVPSRMSSVDATRPKSVASYWHPSANGISAPLLTALMM